MALFVPVLSVRSIIRANTNNTHMTVLSASVQIFSVFLFWNFVDVTYVYVWIRVIALNKRTVIRANEYKVGIYIQLTQTLHIHMKIEWCCTRPCHNEWFIGSDKNLILWMGSLYERLAHIGYKRLSERKERWIAKMKKRKTKCRREGVLLGRSHMRTV